MKRYAILIGSSRFDKEPKLNPLRCPENDVDGMHEIVSAAELGAFTETFVYKNADHQTILNQIAGTLSDASNEDQVLIYYSGHGKRGRTGQLYLTTANTENRILHTTSIPLPSLREIFADSDCKKIALILDCCFAGAAGEAFKSDDEEKLKEFSSGNGIYLLTASTANQTAVEKEFDDYSLLTKHIINGIRSGAAARPNSSHISIEDIYSYVHRQVTAEGHQQPMRWALNVRGEELIIARSAMRYSTERLRIFKKKINDLDTNDYISEKIANDARRIIAANQQKQDQVFFDLLNHLYEGTFGTGTFSQKWLELMGVPQQAEQPVPIVPEPVLEETRQPQEQQQEEPQPSKQIVPVVTEPMLEAVLQQHEQQEKVVQEPPPPKEHQPKQEPPQLEVELSPIVREPISEEPPRPQPENKESLQQTEQVGPIVPEPVLEDSPQPQEQQNRISSGTREVSMFDHVLVSPDDKTIFNTSKLGLGVAGAVVLFISIWVGIQMKTSTPPIANNFTQQEQVKPAGFTENLNGVNLEMILVPAGKFTMGSDKSDDEKPPHEVSVPSFHIGKDEVTQAQWKAVMGDKLKPSFKGDDLPMESISWNDAQAFCQKLSQMTGKKYRLPSEAEWEYACRAGTTGDYAGTLDEMAWYGNNSGKAALDASNIWFDEVKKDADKYNKRLLGNGCQTHPVGQKKLNAFGLYDMHGNVWEWCEDVWHDSYNNAPKDGSAWTGGGNSKFRVLRGGSWNYLDINCRSANRGNLDPGVRDYYIGFRVVVGARTP